MTARTKKAPSQASKSKRLSPDSAFERRFRTAARRVLRRRGVPADRIETEIARLRRAKFAITLPTVKELEKALAEVADAD
jgi:hypothetical protein